MKLLRLLIWLLLPTGMFASTALDSARRAQALLGTEKWSQVIRVENAAPRGVYPAQVDALVFEEGGLLWIYTAFDGTQSLSQYWNRTETDRHDLAPLLRTIHPGLVRYSGLTDGTVAGGEGPLPNGCFIESLAALRSRLAHGDPLVRPRLLACSVNTPEGLCGHTVLTYETPRGFFLLDPTRSPRPRLMPGKWRENPLALAAAALGGSRVARARWVPVDIPAVVTGQLMAQANPHRNWPDRTAARAVQ